MEPELSWPDNTNLVHAQRLLEPIKNKYGLGLSWGDLMVLAGTVAIEDMGGPVLGFAAGRIDQVDNSQTIALGPSEAQDRFKHIEVDGMAEAPLGQNTMGLIYVNPAGPMGVPDPQGAADVSQQLVSSSVCHTRVIVSHSLRFTCCITPSPDNVSQAEPESLSHFHSEYSSILTFFHIPFYFLQSRCVWKNGYGRS